MAGDNGGLVNQGLLDKEQLRRSLGELRAEEDQAEQIDFKMVTFSIGGKDYAIDIMKVKEIAKYDSFTFVPNTPPFVTGVYNLRGEIISVIDLRVLFNLTVTTSPREAKASGLILRLETGLIGVVVDAIDKVIGINSETIQPPHPLFADVNLKYLSGIVEYEDKLYILLDVERVLGIEDTVESLPVIANLPAAKPVDRAIRQEEANLAGFIGQTVAALRGFTTSDVNREWIDRRAAEWSSSHGSNAQIRTVEEADEFLSTFFSTYAGQFWGDDYLDEWRRVLPDVWRGPLTVWNPGCGTGHEAYSLACLLRSLYPDALVKIWASDNDLINVSTAPNLTVHANELPEIYQRFLVQAVSGHGFAREIKDGILFEYSDIANANAVPPSNIVLIRDVLSFLSEAEQTRVLKMIEEKCSAHAIVACGSSERLTALAGFQDISQQKLRAYQRA